MTLSKQAEKLLDEWVKEDMEDILDWEEFKDGNYPDCLKEADIESFAKFCVKQLQDSTKAEE